MDKGVFGQRLKMARVLKGLSLRELSEKMNNPVSHTALSKYEKGDMLPSSTILIDLSRVLSVSVDYLFRKITPLSLTPQFRKGSNLSAKDENRIIEITRSHLERYIIASEAAGFDFYYNLSKYKVNNITDALNAAVNLRKELNIGDSPITDLVSELEEASIVVSEISDVIDFSGVCLSGDNIAAIAINCNCDNVRKRFTLAHELGHLVLTFDEINEKEKENLCNVFAGAFLVPPTEVKRHLGDKRESLYLDELLSIKEVYGISIQALAYQLVHNGIISKRKHSEFKKFIESNDWTINEPGNFKCNNEPKLLKQLVLRALSDSNLSISKASELLDVNQEDIMKMELVF